MHKKSTVFDFFKALNGAFYAIFLCNLTNDSVQSFLNCFNE